MKTECLVEVFYKALALLHAAAGGDKIAEIIDAQGKPAQTWELAATVALALTYANDKGRFLRRSEVIEKLRSLEIQGLESSST